MAIKKFRTHLNIDTVNIYIGVFWVRLNSGIYRFWAYLIWVSRGKKFVKVNTDILCKYFSFLAYQKSVQLLYETFDTLIEAITAFIVRHS